MLSGFSVIKLCSSQNKDIRFSEHCRIPRRFSIVFRKYFVWCTDRQQHSLQVGSVAVGCLCWLVQNV